MEDHISVKPLPRRTRQKTFGFLIFVFLVAIPLLYMYATGYRLDFRRPTNFVSTGGISVTVNETDAEIYIDGEPVRATRAFRRAFYAQGIDVGTHRIHVQKEGFHTWVKELPVSERLVTEVVAFNLPLVPQLRVISPWLSATGTVVVSQPITNASTTNEILATSTKNTKSFTPNEEFKTLMVSFATTSTSTHKESTTQQIKDLLQKNGTTSPTTEETATTTVISGGVKLHERDDDVYATWVGSFEQMPYYYCASDFPRYSTTTPTTTKVAEPANVISTKGEENTEEALVVHPVQTVPADIECDPTIRIDRKWQKINYFTFFPGSTDFTILVQPDGIYVVEIDDRAWQNVQPLMLGSNLKLSIENNNMFVYDGQLVYQVIAELE